MLFYLAAGLGLEPRYSAPKADVLPLDDPAIKNLNLKMPMSKLRQLRKFFYKKNFYSSL